MRARLRRRGVDHGWVAEAPREGDLSRGEPCVLRGLFRPARVSLRIIDGLRAGAELCDLAHAPRGFRWAGVSQNVADPLELERAHVEPGGLWIKVNWLSTHARDASLRLRVSYGLEGLDDFRDDPPSNRRAVQLVEGLFPACRAVTRSRALAAAIGHARFLQPIVYSNAPSGGALFHHDYVPGQAGVVFAQIAGSTGWMAIPRFELERAVEAHLGRRVPRIGERLERRDARIERLLNETPAFTRRLAAAGWFRVLWPGDAIVLPSPTRRGTAWHSVFCVGRRGNLALSMGFAAPGDDPRIRTNTHES